MIWFFVVLLGLSIGSFLNVLIIRLPLNASLITPSHCTHCRNRLKFWHNIPIVSYLALKGRCAYCNHKISLQYLSIEILTALIFIAVFYTLGFTFQALSSALTLALLLALSVIDWHYKAVPDSINLLALACALVASPAAGTSLIHALLFAGGFALLGFVLTYYMSYKLKLLRYFNTKASWLNAYMPKQMQALGEADIIVGATIGALLGISLGVFAIFLAALFALVAALIIRPSDKQTPFVPFLSLGAFVSFLFQTPLLQLVEHLYA